MNFESYFDPKQEHCCQYCTDNLLEENFVLYKDNEDSEWKSCIYCKKCVTYMIQTKWQEYIDKVASANCEAELRRLLLRDGPPVNFRDNFVKCMNTGREVCKFYFSGQEQSAKLEGSLVGEERDKWLNDKLVMFVDILKN